MFPSEDQIRLRAYNIWKTTGRTDEKANWEQAEKELKWFKEIQDCVNYMNDYSLEVCGCVNYMNSLDVCDEESNSELGEYIGSPYDE